MNDVERAREALAAALEAERAATPKFPKTVTEYGVRFAATEVQIERSVRCDGPETATHLVAHHPARPKLLTRQVTIHTDWIEDES